MAECPRGALPACAGEAGPVAVYPVVTRPVKAQTLCKRRKSDIQGLGDQLSLGAQGSWKTGASSPGVPFSPARGDAEAEQGVARDATS